MNKKINTGFEIWKKKKKDAKRSPKLFLDKSNLLHFGVNK